MGIPGAHRWLAAIAIAALAACSNGRGSVSDPADGPVGAPPPAEPPPTPPPGPPAEPPPEPPPTPPPEPPPETSSAAMAGFWKGTATADDSDRQFEMVALIDAEGAAQWLLTRDAFLGDDGFVVFGNVCCEARFADAIAGKELRESRTRDARIDVEIDGGVLRGKLEFDRDDYTFTLSPSADYNRAVSLAALAGVYSQRTQSILGEEVTLTLTIEASGRLTGSYSNGCVFNGGASIPDPAHNMVELQIDLANCGRHGSSRQWNGTYSGLGLLLDDDVFFHSVIGPTWLGPLSVER